MPCLDLMRSAEKFFSTALRETSCSRYRVSCDQLEDGRALRRRHPLDDGHLRHRACGNGEDSSCHGDGHRRAQGKEVGRIILTRPIVEGARAWGFAGTLTEKVDPYIRPPLRRSVRHDRHGARHAARRERRHRDRPARVHARAHRSTTAASSSTRRRTPRLSR